MNQHPWKILKEIIKSKSLTQRQFAILLWKKVSELNELINWKRNITVQWDILLSHVLWTDPKYRLNLQNDYDYQIAKDDFDTSSLQKIEELASDKVEKINKEEKNTQELSKPKTQSNKPDINLPSKSKHQIPIKKPEKIIDSWYKNNKYDKQKIYNEDDRFDSYFSPKDKKEKHGLTSVNVDKNWKNKKLNSGRNPTTTSGVGSEWQKKWQEKKDDHKDHHKHKENVFRNF